MIVLLTGAWAMKDTDVATPVSDEVATPPSADLTAPPVPTGPVPVTPPVPPTPALPAEPKTPRVMPAQHAQAYKDATDNLIYLKKEQVQITYYTWLLLAALYL